MEETPGQLAKRADLSTGDVWPRRAWAMRHVVDLIALDRTDLSAPEDAAVRVLCEQYGYGAVMDAAARLWARKDALGAFTVGPCRILVQDALFTWDEIE